MNKNEYKYSFLTEHGQGPVILLITSSWDQGQAQKICGHIEESFGQAFDLCELQVEDWDRYLTPWPVDRCMKGRTFSGEAGQLLDEIEQAIIPGIRAHYRPKDAEQSILMDRPIYIAGYSLAGLFSMWAGYETGLFAGIACCSGSLWYPGWQEYMSERSFNQEIAVYLSLGENEPKSRNPLMRQVGQITGFQHERLLADAMVQKTTFEWNEGGHFTEPDVRLVKGIQYLLDQQA